MDRRLPQKRQSGWDENFVRKKLCVFFYFFLFHLSCLNIFVSSKVLIFSLYYCQYIFVWISGLNSLYVKEIPKLGTHAWNKFTWKGKLYWKITGYMKTKQQSFKHIPAKRQIKMTTNYAFNINVYCYHISFVPFIKDY